jgi:hypothetical protein
MKVLSVLLFLLVSVIIPPAIGLGQSPLPPGPLEVRPLPGETETVRAGGPDGFFTWRGALRCERPEEAIVGVRVRRGSVLDYLQIVCAEISCANGRCGWTRYLSTRSAGNRDGGGPLTLLRCGQNEVLSGYRARVKNVAGLNYIEDIAIECGKIAGPPGGPNAVPILPERDSWHNAGGRLDRPQFEGLCPATGATAIAAFAGRWVTGPTVVQAMALLCGNPSGPCPVGSHTNFTPLAGLYRRPANACPECCKRCVDLHGSTQPVTGRTDREVANLAAHRYNCHFYTLSYMNYVTPPVDKGRVPRQFEKLPLVDFEVSSTRLSDEDLQNRYGWSPIQRVPGDLRPGDVVTVPENGGRTASVHHNFHSGIVIQSGNNVVIRQKPNPFACVTDFTWQEFIAFYQAQRVNGWRLGARPEY